MFVPPVNVADTRGFSLVEMAIALFIFALVISSILEPAADLYERRKNTAAREYLDTASQAVLDYALRNRTIYREIDYDGVAPAESIPDGRPYLPCPDTDGDGIENRNLIPAGIPIPRASLTVAGTCDQHKGTLPWKTLEMQQGTDPWGNRLTYHADSSYSNALFGFDETTRADKHDTRMPPPTGAMTIYPPKSTVALSPFVVCGYNATTICSEVIAGVASNANITIGARQYTSGILTNAIVEGVAFLVLSHGQNGRYARDGESGNCNSGDGVVVANFNCPRRFVAGGITHYRHFCALLYCRPLTVISFFYQDAGYRHQSGTAEQAENYHDNGNFYQIKSAPVFHRFHHSKNGSLPIGSAPPFVNAPIISSAIVQRKISSNCPVVGRSVWG